MPDANLVILYVDNPAASAAFYRDLLARDPIEQSEDFAMLPLAPGLALGLWSRHAVEPAASATGGGSEVCFPVEDVDAVHAAWSQRGVTVMQPPTEMDFGRTLVGLDPDGHRLRVYRPARA